MEFNFGKMPEWLNGLAWKACILQKGIEGSNPSLSAVRLKTLRGCSKGFFHFKNIPIFPLFPLKKLVLETFWRFMRKLKLENLLDAPH